MENYSGKVFLLPNVNLSEKGKNLNFHSNKNNGLNE